MTSVEQSVPLPARVRSSGSLQETGFALVMTLWTLVMLSTVVTHFAYQARIETRLTRWSLNQALLHWAVRGAAHTASARVAAHIAEKYNGPASAWWSGKDYRELLLGGARVSFRRPVQRNDKREFGLDDEESRLNINAASAEQLMGFTGISSVMAEAIVRFRNELKERRETEPRDGRTTEASPSNSSTELVDGPIQSLRELLLVKDVTEALLYEPRGDKASLSELLTTISTGKVNVNSASAEVLAAAGLSEGQVNSVVALRNKGPIKALVDLQAAIASAKSPELWQRAEKVVTVRSTTFRLSVEARLPASNAIYRLNATVYFADNKFKFIRWREYADEAAVRT